jgi:hypothetical protein
VLSEGIEMWSRSAEQVVSRLIAELPEGLAAETRSHAERLKALPIGWSMWAGYFLRANGEVVVVGEDEDHPEADTIHTERGHVLRALVWGSERYPELRRLLPARGPGAVDCRCRAIPLFAEGKVLCPECGGLGWLPRSGG